MGLLEELKERADKLDAELLALSARMKEIERESAEVHTCINALDIAEMDAEDELLDEIAEQVALDDAAFEADGYQHVVDAEPADQPVDTWIEADAFVYPKHRARIAARWSDGATTELHFTGYTVTTGEPNWIAEKRGDATVTHLLVIPEPAPLIIEDANSVEELGEQSEPFKMEEVEAEEPRDPDLVLTEAVLEEITDLAEQKLEAVPVEHPDAPFWARVLTRKKEDA